MQRLHDMSRRMCTVGTKLIAGVLAVLAAVAGYWIYSDEPDKQVATAQEVEVAAPAKERRRQRRKASIPPACRTMS